MQSSPLYLGDASLLEAQEINRQQKQFRKYYEFELNPEESTTLELHYHWKGFNVEPGDEETTRVLINLVVERLDQNLAGKPFDLKTIVKEVQRFRKEFNDIGYGLCLSPEMTRHLEHLVDEKKKHGEYSFFNAENKNGKTVWNVEKIDNLNPIDDDGFITLKKLADNENIIGWMYWNVD